MHLGPVADGLRRGLAHLERDADETEAEDHLLGHHPLEVVHAGRRAQSAWASFVDGAGPRNTSWRGWSTYTTGLRPTDVNAASTAAA